MSGRYSAEQALELIFSDFQQEDLEDEEISEEEDGEEYNAQHDESSSDEETLQPEQETFSSKNGKIIWSSSPYNNPGRMAAQNVMKMTPGPTRYAVSHVEDIASTFHLLIIPAI